MISKNEQLELAIEFAKKAHSDQKRKFSKEPYYNHCFRVMEKIKQAGLNVDHQAVAILHDVIEDSSNPDSAMAEIEKMGFKKKVMEALLILTRKKTDSYFEYILNIRNNKMAKTVKLADLEDNMKDNLKEGSLLDKYRLAYFLLCNSEDLSDETIDHYKKILK